MKKKLKHKTSVHIKLEDELIAYLDSKQGKSRSGAIRDIIWSHYLIELNRKTTEDRCHF